MRRESSTVVVVVGEVQEVLLDQVARFPNVSLARPPDGRVLDVLRSLPHGPWWPPLGELIETARHFFAGSLAEGEAR
jgi:hypothetical protein